MLEVIGARHLPLYSHELLVLTDEELKQFVERTAQEGHEELT
jgi:hypothetical protein